jgi:DNA-binding NtrC family response regulator
MISARNKKILLIVNDDPDILELLQRHLASREYETLIARGKGEAIHILETTPIDLGIINLNKPIAGGHDLVRLIRKNFLHTEVMIVTGSVAIREAIAAAKEGAAEYLVKPFTEEELFAGVQKALAKLGVHQAAGAQAYLGKSAYETSAPRSIY